MLAPAPDVRAAIDAASPERVVVDDQGVTVTWLAARADYGAIVALGDAARAAAGVYR